MTGYIDHAHVHRSEEFWAPFHAKCDELGSTSDAIEFFLDRIEELEKALRNITPPEHECWTVEIERNRFGVTAHVNHRHYCNEFSSVAFVDAWATP